MGVGISYLQMLSVSVCAPLCGVTVSSSLEGGSEFMVWEKNGIVYISKCISSVFTVLLSSMAKTEHHLLKWICFC